MAGSLFIPSQTYTFQVAARNSNGVGPFSDPVIAILTTQGTICMFSAQYNIIFISKHNTPPPHTYI